METVLKLSNNVFIELGLHSEKDPKDCPIRFKLFDLTRCRWMLVKQDHCVEVNPGGSLFLSAKDTKDSIDCKPEFEGLLMESEVSLSVTTSPPSSQEFDSRSTVYLPAVA